MYPWPAKHCIFVVPAEVLLSLAATVQTVMAWLLASTGCLCAGRWTDA